MPQWSPEPPRETDEYAHRIVRTPATSDFKAIITCQNAIGCPTHFLNNRTTPCEGKPDCEACNIGHSARWHGWVSCLHTRTLEHCLFEFTAPSCDVLKNYLNQNGTLRGCGITASRPSKKQNGRVLITTQPVDQGKWRLPDEPNIMRILCHIWGVPYLSIHKAPDKRAPAPRYRHRPKQRRREEPSMTEFNDPTETHICPICGNETTGSFNQYGRRNEECNPCRGNQEIQGELWNDSPRTPKRKRKRKTKRKPPK